MVSSGVFALVLAALVQASVGHCYPPVKYEEGCCPGKVIERKYVVNRPVTETFTYNVPITSRKCQQSTTVDKQVIPKSFTTPAVCQTQETIVKVPTTDLEIQTQPLCKRTCTTSEYIIQIPIRETTCSNSPLCKKTVRSQENLLTTVSKKTSCNKQVCTQNTVVQKPIISTVCQDYQQQVSKVGTKTVLKPEIKKSCYQLPPYKCMKPVYGSTTPDYTPAQAYYSTGAEAFAQAQAQAGSFSYGGAQSFPSAEAYSDASASSGSVVQGGAAYDIPASSWNVAQGGAAYDIPASSWNVAQGGAAYDIPAPDDSSCSCSCA